MPRTTHIHLEISILLALCACSDDEPSANVLPDCDDIDWPLGIESDAALPPAAFPVECARGWGNIVETRAPLRTLALPYDTWDEAPHPHGGWMFVVVPEHQPGWAAWLEQQGVDASTVPGQVLLHYEEDGTLGWIVSDYSIWMIELVGDDLWALGRSEDFAFWLLVFDPATGELTDAHPWDTELRYNRLEAARDPAGGAWISGIGNRQEDGQVVQSLYRATSIEALDLVASRTTDDPLQAPSGGIHALQDGAAAWWTGPGFEILERHGSVRWTHASGIGVASNADAMLVVSHIPTGVGNGMSLRLEKVSVSDGALIWQREHQRFVVADPEGCGDDCTLTDSANPLLRPDGGYLLVGRHAYPSTSCPGQPLLMAVSADGDAEWAHRVESCGSAYRVAFRDGSRLEFLGATFGGTQIEAWHRWIRLKEDRSRSGTPS